ncbi:B-cell receptor CD22 [Nothobranchius furzeri]|uniref:B-cell receptor CD22 n=1 Tax=Nothobranchius furzeri TaxID=105023 RepID=UPI00077CF5EE
MRRAASGVLVLLTATVICQTDWSVTYNPPQICTLEGSAVKIISHFSYPKYVTGSWVKTTVNNYFWFTKTTEEGEPVDLRDDPDYSGRVSYEKCGNKVCHLLITNVTKSDSNEFKFRFITNQQSGSFTGVPGVTLSVTGLKVNVYSAKTYLTCHSDCQLPARVSYCWYKNGQKLGRSTTKYLWYQISPAGRYQCAIEGLEQFPSPPVYAPAVPSVSTNPSGEIMEDRSVTLTCSSDANPAAKYTWYEKDGDQNYKHLSSEQHHVFSSIKSSDSGWYWCEAENDLGRQTSRLFIDVKYPPRRPSVSLSSSGLIEEGEPVTLTCSSDANPAANYTWYKEDNKHPIGVKSDYRVPSVTSEDRGHYICMSENQYGQRNSSCLFVDILYRPKSPLVSVSPLGEIMEDSSVNLTCSSDANPAANYTWYKEDKLLSSEQNFTISNIKPEHSGEYHCRVQNRVGLNNSSKRVTVAASSNSRTMVIAGTMVVLFIILVLLVFLVMRKKRSSVPSPELGESPNIIKQHQPRQSENQDLHYASVRFLKNESDDLYMNIKPLRTRRPKEEETEISEYSTVNLVNNRSDSGKQDQEAAADPSALYSVVHNLR